MTGLIDTSVVTHEIAVSEDDLKAVPALIAALRAMQAELANGSFYKEADIDDLMNRAEAAEAKLAEVEKAFETHCVLLQETEAQLSEANATVATLTAQVEAMRGTLEWYADPDTYETQYEPLHCGCCTDIFEPINIDKGEKARAALTTEKTNG